MDPSGLYPLEEESVFDFYSLASRYQPSPSILASPDRIVVLSFHSLPALQILILQDPKWELAATFGLDKAKLYVKGNTGILISLEKQPDGEAALAKAVWDLGTRNFFILEILSAATDLLHYTEYGIGEETVIGSSFKPAEPGMMVRALGAAFFALADVESGKATLVGDRYLSDLAVALVSGKEESRSSASITLVQSLYLGYRPSIERLLTAWRSTGLPELDVDLVRDAQRKLLVVEEASRYYM